MLIKRGLDVCFTLGTPFTKTITTIDDYITRISNMGDFDWPKFKSVMLINALGGDLEYLQSQIHGMADDPGFSSATIIHRIIQEQDLIKHYAVQGEGPSALISQTKKCEQTICSHCQRPGHSANFCIAPGGKFIGTTESAQIALSPIVNPHFKFSAYEAHHQEGATLHTSINWDDFCSED